MKDKKRSWTTAEAGQKGGKAGTGKAKARTREQAQFAAYVRWDFYREAAPKPRRKPLPLWRVILQYCVSTPDAKIAARAVQRELKRKEVKP